MNRLVLAAGILAVLATQALGVPPPPLRTVPICERASAGFEGECFPEEYVNQREFTVFLFHIIRAIGTRCEFGVKDPNLRPTRNNLVLLSCPELSLADLARPKPEE